VSVFIEEHRERFRVEPICETLGVSASAYYERASGRRSARAPEDERLLGVITELHRRNYLAYGSRRMRKALLRSGEQIGRSRVERLMRENGLQGAKRRGKPWRTTRADRSRSAVRISCSATSGPRGRMSCGSRTSPTSTALSLSSPTTCASANTQPSRVNRNTATVSACSWSSGCSATSSSIAACISLWAPARATRSTRQLSVRSASA
jgi:hypothetical protein